MELQEILKASNKTTRSNLKSKERLPLQDKTNILIKNDNQCNAMGRKVKTSEKTAGKLQMPSSKNQNTLETTRRKKEKQPERPKLGQKSKDTSVVSKSTVVQSASRTTRNKPVEEDKILQEVSKETQNQNDLNNVENQQGLRRSARGLKKQSQSSEKLAGNKKNSADSQEAELLHNKSRSRTSLNKVIEKAKINKEKAKINKEKVAEVQNQKEQNALNSGENQQGLRVSTRGSRNQRQSAKEHKEKEGVEKTSDSQVAEVPIHKTRSQAMRSNIAVETKIDMKKTEEQNLNKRDRQSFKNGNKKEITPSAEQAQTNKRSSRISKKLDKVTTVSSDSKNTKKTVKKQTKILDFVEPTTIRTLRPKKNPKNVNTDLEGKTIPIYKRVCNSPENSVLDVYDFDASDTEDIPKRRKGKKRGTSVGYEKDMDVVVKRLEKKFKKTRQPKKIKTTQKNNIQKGPPNVDLAKSTNTKNLVKQIPQKKSPKDPQKVPKIIHDCVIRPPKETSQIASKTTPQPNIITSKISPHITSTVTSQDNIITSNISSPNKIHDSSLHGNITSHINSNVNIITSKISPHITSTVTSQDNIITSHISSSNKIHDSSLHGNITSHINSNVNIITSKISPHITSTVTSIGNIITSNISSSNKIHDSSLHGNITPHINPNVNIITSNVSPHITSTVNIITSNISPDITSTISSPHTIHDSPFHDNITTNASPQITSKRNLTSNVSSPNEIFDFEEPIANSTVLNITRTEAQASPWRSNINMVRNPHFLRFKESFLPNYNQDMVLDSSMVEKIAPKNVEKRKQSPKQASILNYIDGKENEVTTVNCTLFDVDQFSPIKEKTKENLESGNSPIVVDKENSLKKRVDKAKRNILGPIVDNQQNLSSPEIVRNTSPGISNYFGFDDSFNAVEPQGEKPARLDTFVEVMRRKNQVFDDLDHDVNKNQEKLDENAANKEIGLFEDYHPDRSLEYSAIRQYVVKKKRHRRCRSPSPYSDDDDEENHHHKKKRNKRTKKEEEEADRWAAAFNSMCEEVEKFPLEIE